MAAPVSEKEALFARALEETRRGRDLLAGRDIDGFEASVAARQALFDEIDRLDAAKVGFRADPGAAERIHALIGEIIELDRDTARLAGEVSAELSQNLKEVGSGKRLLAYEGAAGPGGMFVNKKG